MRGGHPIRPGDVVIWSLFTLGHAADVPLTRRGHDTVSTCFRRLVYFLVWAEFGWHAFRPRRFEPWDIRWQIGKRWPPPRATD